MKKNNAFTLVELLISASIFLVVMATIYSAFNTGLFGYRNIEENINVHQTASLILERINLDLRNSFAYAENNSMFQGGKNAFSFLTAVDTFKNDKIVPEFALVSYWLEGDKLMRLCRKNKESLNDGSTVKAEELCTNISAIEFTYAGIAANSNSLQWQDSWNDESGPSPSSTPLPAVVKVKLTVKEKINYDFERTMYLPLS